MDAAVPQTFTSSFPRRRESISQCWRWIPACAGMTKGLVAAALLAAPTLTSAQTPATETSTEQPRTAEVVAEVAASKSIIILPPFTTPTNTTVAGLSTNSLGGQIASVIAANLERSGLYAPIGPSGLRQISMGEEIGRAHV